MAPSWLVPVLLYSAFFAAGTLWTWRHCTHWGPIWHGEADPKWLRRRRLATAVQWGATAAVPAGLLLSGLFGVIGQEQLSHSQLAMVIWTFPIVMLACVLNVALSGPPSTRSVDGSSGGSGHSSEDAMLTYRNTDWFARLELIVLLALSIFAGLLAVLPELNTEEIPVPIAWGFCAACGLGLVTLLGQTVQYAQADGARIEGRTLGGRRFSYRLRDLQVSVRTAESPSREFLVVSCGGRWPVVLSSRGSGYDWLAQRLWGSETDGEASGEA